MSGLEVVGALASVCQLIAYGANIIVGLKEYYGSEMAMSKRRDVQIDKVRQLIRIADIVQNTKALHTELIDSHIGIINQSARDVLGMLQMGKERPAKMWEKVRKAVQLNNIEQRIERGLGILEQSKSSLALCILSSHGTVIFEIHENVRQGIPELRAAMTDMDAKLDTYPEVLSEIRQTRQMLAETVKRAGESKDRGATLSNILGDMQLLDTTALSQERVDADPNWQVAKSCGQPCSDCWQVVGSNNECCAEPHSDSLNSSTVLSFDHEPPESESKPSEERTPCAWSKQTPFQATIRGARGTQPRRRSSWNKQDAIDERQCSENAIMIPSATTLDCVESPRTVVPPNSATYVDNFASGSALQVNGDLGVYELPLPAIRSRQVAGNRAMDNSLQVNGDILDPALLQILLSARVR